MRASIVLALLAGLVVAGCGGVEHYAVEVRPQGDALDRRLECWCTHPQSAEPAKLSPFPEEELLSVAERYGSPLPADAKEPVHHRFRASFSDGHANELGGTGRHASYTDVLGTVGVWSETFGGEPDPRTARGERYAIVDRFLVLLAGFLRHEFGDTPDVEQAEAFLHSEIRDDLRTMIDLTWTAQTMTALGADEEVVEETVRARADRHFVDRGYGKPIDVATDRVNLGMLSEDGIARRVAQHLGWQEGDPFPATAAALRWGGEGGEERFLAYGRTLPVYQERYAAWEVRQTLDPGTEEPPDPKEVIGEEFQQGGRVFGIPVLEGHARLEVALLLPVEPFQTNGRWDAAKGAVCWEGKVMEGFGLPFLCAASWAAPDVEHQTRLFGRVVLEDEALAAYVRDHLELPADVAERWDDFLEDLRPGPDLVDRVREFTLDTEEATRALQAVREGLTNVLDVPEPG